MNLTIDIGNTRAKLAIFENNKIVETKTISDFTVKSIQNFTKNRNIAAAILSSVKNIQPSIIDFLQSKFDLYIELTNETKVPIDNLYKSKNTLGKDRLAAIVGANNIFPHTNVLVIDMGTAITFDFINNKNQYLGGTISPGLEMRFKALNKFTDKLPLLEKNEDFQLIGDQTESAIISGVQNGIIFETNNYINQFKEKYNDLKIILTGGDAIFFDKKLKNTIFVNLNLNDIGLNTILEHNKIK